MSEKFRLRPALQNTPAYVPGKPPKATEGLKTFKLSSNEHHMDPLPAVAEAIAAGGRTPASYADPSVAELTAALADHLGVSTEAVLFSAGASEMLKALFHITVDPGDEVVYPWPSFEMYPQLANLCGATHQRISVDADGRHDLPAMAAAISERTRLVILCSPNNPTGPALRQGEFDAFMSKVPADVIVILDEAYIDFCDADDAADGLAALGRHPNLVLLRTFSKSYGLAGLRVGYAVADPELIMELRKSILPFSVSASAQQAALVSLQHSQDMEVRAKEVARLRDDLAAGLRERGFEVFDAHGNFVWLNLGQRSDDFERACLEAGLAVRNLGEGVRISVGPAEAMQRVLQVAGDFAAAGGAVSDAGAPTEAEGAPK